MSNPVLQRGRKTTRLVLLGGLVVLFMGFAASPSWGEPGDDNAGGNSGGNRANSGERKSADSGGDTQGKSDSNPDGGGVDKPGCESDSRGCQGTSADRDGNNGCGNDADREDDNKGNCGRRPARASANASTSATATGTAVAAFEAVAAASADAARSTRSGWMGFRRATARAQVAGQPVAAAAVETPTLAFAESTSPRVLGQSFSRESRPRSFAFTGGDLLKLALVAFAAIAAGWGIRRSGVVSD